VSIDPREYLINLKGRRPAPAFVTVYDAAFARLAEDAGAAGLIVGDTVGPLALGLASPDDVTLAMMEHHASAVKRGACNVPVIADVPLSTLRLDTSRAYEECRRLDAATEVEALKIEGASAGVLRLIERLANDGLRVSGHLEGPHCSSDDARRLGDAGIVCLVLVSVGAQLAADITRAMTIPTIGKASGLECDAQVVNAYQALGPLLPEALRSRMV
jgi:3-methyl-2-oxobutanoate hydroxymethyltransferase